MPERIGIKKDEAKGIFILLVSLSESSEPIEITMTKEYIEKILTSELPNEEKSLNDALKKIQEIRMKRLLYIEKIDDELKELMKDAEAKYDAIQTKIETFKYASLMKTKLSIITQKRHLAKLAAQEEAELRVKLAKLQRGE